ncbi:MAG: hypothetical protein IJU44_05155, partial [Kiritimatiellae bacterium]|nr:hypothetical protein [Kiritimatiellia bacterium]
MRLLADPSGERIGAALRGYCSAAMAASGPSLFGEGSKPAREDLLADAFARANDDARYSVGGLSAEGLRQYDAVVARYTNPDGSRKPGWMKAPNGRPTSLTERQWVQVNTPNFRANFFGFYNLPKHEFWIVECEAAPFGNTKDALEWTERNGIIGIMTPDETNGKGEINISKSSVREMLNPSQREKSVSPEAHYAALSHLRDIIRESELADRHPDYKKGEDGKRDPENGVNPDVTIDVLYGAMRFSGQTYRVKTTLKRYADTERKTKAYAYDVSEIEVLTGNLVGPGDGSNPNANTSITGDMLLQGVRNSKGNLILEDFSKVVDANGEPKVVYHGTPKSNGDFAEFKRQPRGASQFDIDGFYFSPDASSYIFGEGDRSIPVFLNIRNPARQGRKLVGKTADGKHNRYVSTFGKDRDYKRAEGRARLVEDGFDGAFRGDGNDGVPGEYIALYPSQIKSATDNSGGFSGENPDIRYSVALPGGRLSALEDKHKYSVAQRGGEVKGVSAEEDAAYMDAVRRGDTETAERMVREAAARVGYVIEAWHGTKGEVSLERLPARVLTETERRQYENERKDVKGATLEWHQKRNVRSYCEYKGIDFDSLSDEEINAMHDEAFEFLKNVGFLSNEERQKYYAADDRAYKKHIEEFGREPSPLDVDRKWGQWPEDKWTVTKPSTFTVFDADKSRDVGFHFSDEPTTAEEFAFKNQVANEGRLIHVFLKGEIIDFSDVFSRYLGLEDALREFYRVGLLTRGSWNKLIDRAKRYDAETEIEERDWGDRPKVINWWRHLRKAVEKTARKENDIVLKYDNEVEGGGAFAVLKPSQIKSADPVTYDDAGNVIPLSRRFDEEHEDINYSVGGVPPREAEAARTARAGAMELLRGVG